MKANKKITVPSLQAMKREKRKIVALTAHALEEERLEILAAGCDDFIRKPYKDTEIFNAMVKHLGVDLLYAEQSVPDANITYDNSAVLDQEKLKKIPIDLIEKLQEAVILLDTQLCLKATGKSSDHNHETGRHLQNMVENLQYKDILIILDNITQKDKNE